MKNRKLILWANAVAFAAIFTVTACEKTQSLMENDVPAAAYITQADYLKAEYALLTLVFDSSATITEEEGNMLIAMKEEEKLARDVYMRLYELWGSKVFLNIAGSEQRHVDAVLKLIRFYNLPDSLVEEPGVFATEELKTLYDDLITIGSASEAEGFKTGALIEDMDIHDLNTNLTGITNANIKLVFENLRSGSYNHLVSFTRQLTMLGITYSPVYISAEEYNLILTTTPAPGNRRGWNR